jgi:hypothetical protein
MIRGVFGMLAVAALQSAANADIPVPGHKPVKSMARFENLKDYPDYNFYVVVHPDNKLTGTSISPTETISLKATPIDLEHAEISLHTHDAEGSQFLLAVPKKLNESVGSAPLSSWLDGKMPGILQAEIKPGQGSTPESDPRSEFWRNYQIHIVGTVMSLEIRAEDMPRGSPQWLIAGSVGFLALATLAALYWYLHRDKARRTTV